MSAAAIIMGIIGVLSVSALVGVLIYVIVTQPPTPTNDGDTPPVPPPTSPTSSTSTPTTTTTVTSSTGDSTSPSTMAPPVSSSTPMAITKEYSLEELAKLATDKYNTDNEHTKRTKVYQSGTIVDDDSVDLLYHYYRDGSFTHIDSRRYNYVRTPDLEYLANDGKNSGSKKLPNEITSQYTTMELWNNLVRFYLTTQGITATQIDAVPANTNSVEYLYSTSTGSKEYRTVTFGRDPITGRVVVQSLGSVDSAPTLMARYKLSTANTVSLGSSNMYFVYSDDGRYWADRSDTSNVLGTSSSQYKSIPIQFESAGSANKYYIKIENLYLGSTVSDDKLRMYPMSTGENLVWEIGFNGQKYAIQNPKTLDCITMVDGLVVGAETTNAGGIPYIWSIKDLGTPATTSLDTMKTILPYLYDTDLQGSNGTWNSTYLVRYVPKMETVWAVDSSDNLVYNPIPPSPYPKSVLFEIKNHPNTKFPYSNVVTIKTSDGKYLSSTTKSTKIELVSVADMFNEAWYLHFTDVGLCIRNVYTGKYIVYNYVSGPNLSNVKPSTCVWKLQGASTPYVSPTIEYPSSPTTTAPAQGRLFGEGPHHLMTSLDKCTRPYFTYASAGMGMSSIPTSVSLEYGSDLDKYHIKSGGSYLSVDWSKMTWMHQPTKSMSSVWKIEKSGSYYRISSTRMYNGQSESAYLRVDGCIPYMSTFPGGEWVTIKPSTTV